MKNKQYIYMVSKSDVFFQGGKVNNIWNELEHLCKERDYIKYTDSNQVLIDLNANTYYRVELKAHSQLGYSHPSTVYVKTARGESPNTIDTLSYQAGFGVNKASTKNSLYFVFSCYSLSLFLCNIFVFF